VKIGLKSSFVDDHLVVKPAQDDEVVLIGAASLAPGDQVVDLESVAAVTAVSPAYVSVLAISARFKPGGAVLCRRP